MSLPFAQLHTSLTVLQPTPLTLPVRRSPHLTMKKVRSFSLQDVGLIMTHGLYSYKDKSTEFCPQKVQVVNTHTHAQT